MSASPKENLRVVCQCCEGKGEVQLSDDLQRTYQVALKMSKITAVPLAKLLKWKGSVTAINNRLDDLVKFGLLTRTKNGREVVYAAAK